MSVRFEVTMGCTKGHRLTVSEDEARRLNVTACSECRRPLLAVQVKMINDRKKGRGAKPVQQRCPNHANGDPCCRRQKVGAA